MFIKISVLITAFTLATVVMARNGLHDSIQTGYGVQAADPNGQMGVGDHVGNLRALPYDSNAKRTFGGGRPATGRKIGRLGRTRRPGTRPIGPLGPPRRGRKPGFNKPAAKVSATTATAVPIPSVTSLTRRFVNAHCSGPADSLPIDCFQSPPFVPPGKFDSPRDRCSGPVDSLPADCFQSPPFVPPGKFEPRDYDWDIVKRFVDELLDEAE